MDKLNIDQADDGVIFSAKIVPGSSKTAVTGVLNGMLKVKIAAAPEKGKANQCLVEYLAKQLGVKKNCIAITTGKTSPVKTIKITGISSEMILQKFDLK
jgi:uncharacterized protein (TIGR00251 family)